jgi:hypothetical protein
MGWGGPAELSPKKGWAELDPKDLFFFSFLGRDRPIHSSWAITSLTHVHCSCSGQRVKKKKKKRRRKKKKKAT